MLKVRMNAYSERDHRYLIKTSGKYGEDYTYCYCFASDGTYALYEYARYFSDEEIIPADNVMQVCNLDAELITELLYGTEIEVIADAA